MGAAKETMQAQTGLSAVTQIIALSVVQLLSCLFSHLRHSSSRHGESARAGNTILKDRLCIMAWPVPVILMTKWTQKSMLAFLQHVVTVDMTLTSFLVYLLFTTDSMVLLFMVVTCER